MLELKVAKFIQLSPLKYTSLQFQFALIDHIVFNILCKLNFACYCVVLSRAFVLIFKFTLYFLTPIIIVIHDRDITCYYYTVPIGYLSLSHFSSEQKISRIFYYKCMRLIYQLSLPVITFVTGHLNKNINFACKYLTNLIQAFS